MSHHKKLINLAAGEAGDCTVSRQVGAVLAKSGKVFGKGSGDWYRQTFGGQVIAMSGHAEVMAILSSSLRARRLLPSLLSIYGDPRLGRECRGKQGRQPEGKATQWVHYLC